jgi:hypothetical protein
MPTDKPLTSPPPSDKRRARVALSCVLEVEVDSPHTDAELEARAVQSILDTEIELGEACGCFAGLRFVGGAEMRVSLERHRKLVAEYTELHQVAAEIKCAACLLQGTVERQHGEQLPDGYAYAFTFGAAEAQSHNRAALAIPLCQEHRRDYVDTFARLNEREGFVPGSAEPADAIAEVRERLEAGRQKLRAEAAPPLPVLGAGKPGPFDQALVHCTHQHTADDARCTCLDCGAYLVHGVGYQRPGALEAVAQRVALRKFGGAS